MPWLPLVVIYGDVILVTSLLRLAWYKYLVWLAVGECIWPWASGGSFPGVGQWWSFSEGEQKLRN